VVAACALWVGQSPLSPASYARWDSVYYLDIAAHGYLPLTHCPPESLYPTEAWCGNAGWFPGYPWAIWLIARTGLPALAAGFILAAAAQLLCLLAIWSWTRSWHALVLAAFFPGSIYLTAIFPISLFLLLALVCLRCCSSGRVWPAAAAGFGAALCHPLGLLLAPVAMLFCFYRRGRVIIPLGVIAGYGLVLLALQLQAGDWNAYFKLQARYGYQVSFGVDSFLAHLKPLVNARYRDAKGFVTALQTLFCAVLAWSVFLRKRARAQGRETPALIYVAIFWLAPLCLGGRLSLYRSEALLLPAALLVPALPRGLQLTLCAAAVALFIPMSWLFFTNVLV
jgi:hypothetical protein